MALRFALSNQGAAPISPAVDARWEQTAVTRYAMLPQRRCTSAVALANAGAVTVPNTTTQDIVGFQFVGPPMLSKRLTGTFSLVVRVFENANTNNVTLAVVAKIVSIDGGTVRGTLYSNFNIGTEFPLSGSAATRIVDAQAITATTIKTGDRLVVEIGGHAATPTAAGSYTMRFGNPAGTADFARTAALTTNLCPWCELSDDPDVGPGNYMATGYGSIAGERIR